MNRKFIYINDLIDDLEFIIKNNEDDFDRGKGKYILQEYIDELILASARK